MQVLVLALVIAALIFYLLRNLRCRSLLDVTGRTVLITGCDASLGWYLARHYDRLGFRVYAGCNHPAGEGAVRLQAEASARLRIIPLDVTNSASLVEAARTVKEQMPTSEKGLWALINAATFCVCGELQWQTWQHCEKQFHVNFVGVVNTIRTFLPLLKSGRGRIINVGSMAGERNNPEPGFSMYSGTKHAIDGLSEALRFELIRHGVEVSVVQPDVAFLDQCLLDQHHKKMNEMWDQMSAELRAENQDIFIAYHDRIARKEFDSDEMEPQFGNAERKMVALPPSLRHCFDDAIMNKAPSDVYVAVPSALTRLRIALLTFVPTGWREYFIQRKYKHNIASILKV